MIAQLLVAARGEPYIEEVLMPENNDNDQASPLEVDFGSSLVEQMRVVLGQPENPRIVEGEESQPRTNFVVVLPSTGLGEMTAEMVLRMAEQHYQGTVVMGIVAGSGHLAGTIDLPTGERSIGHAELMDVVLKIMEQAESEMLDAVLLPSREREIDVLGLSGPLMGDAIVKVMNRAKYPDEKSVYYDRSDRTRDWESPKRQRMGGKKRKQGRGRRK